MNKAGLFLVVILALASAHTTSAQTRSGNEKTFRGEIADTQCALGVHSLSQSHNEMMGMKPDLKTSAECTRFCVKERGGKFVLQSKDKVYRLDKPNEAEPFAGEQVKIVGTLDPKTNTITIRSITPITPATANPSGGAAILYFRQFRCGLKDVLIIPVSKQTLPIGSAACHRES